MKKIYLSVTLTLLAATLFAQLKYLDKTFGNNGVAATNFNFPATISSVAVQPDKKIITAGTNDGNFALVRYNTNGSPDNNFGTNGKVITDLGSYEVTGGVAIQPDGKIIVAGYTQRGTSPKVKSEIVVLRYNINGTPDNSFGDSGKVFTTVKQQTFGYAIVLQPNGKILVAGSTTGSGYSSKIVLARYKTNGVPDSAFGNDGIVTSSFSLENEAHAIALQQDGKIIAAGFTYDGASNSTNAIAVRYKANGKIDSSFSSKGYIINYEAFYNAVAVQNDDKILLAGNGFNDEYDFFGFVERKNTDGSADTSYGNNGSLAGGYYSGFTSNASSIVLQPDGKAIFSGTRTGDYPDHKKFTGVIRLTMQGQADQTFGDSGIVAIANAQVLDEFTTINPLALQADGKILLGLNFKSGFGAARILPENNIAAANTPQQNMLNIHAYPNPVVNNLIIDGLNKNLPALITITDISGNVMQMQKIQSGINSVNVTMLRQGNYIAVITQNKQTASVKFIKQ